LSVLVVEELVELELQACVECFGDEINARGFIEPEETLTLIDFPESLES